MRVAVVHEYLTAFGGAERVLMDILDVFPQADLYVLTYSSKKLPVWVQKRLLRHRLFVSNLKKVQFFTPLVRLWAPYAVESFNLDNYDLVISNCNSYAKGTLTSTHTLHLSYIHSPTRYLWDYTHPYLKEHTSKRFSLALLRTIFCFQRRWDYLAAQRPDVVLANSKNIKKRIEKYYQRKANVLYPSIRVKKYKVGICKKDYFLVVSRLSPYKKVDLVVRAFKNKNLKLKIVGKGQELKRLKKMAQGAKNIEFLGFVSEKELRKLYAQALAVIFPQIEDFGLVPLEALASGTPVIAYNKGGVLETITEQTGVFFNEQTEKALIKAIDEFLSRKESFSPQVLRQQAEKFDFSHFKKRLLKIVKINQKQKIKKLIKKKK
ncbi:glycosyltransferase [bacterium]|nr:glycosyltransferase [bacterium]